MRIAEVIRWASATTFIVFGVDKLAMHASETHSFRSYGLPAPGVAVILVGLLELVGGALLFTARHRRSVAAALATNMVGAIVVSGIGRGETISLTLAPALLVAMIAVAVTSPRGDAVDAHLGQHPRERFRTPSGRERRGGRESSERH